MDHHHQPVQNSEVYVFKVDPQVHSSHPPPLSPLTPCDTRSMTPVPDTMPIPPLDFRNPGPKFHQRLATAVHVLGTEATALSCLKYLYETDPIGRQGFDQAVQVITRCIQHRGELIICGVGKSGHIAKKLVATMNSLRVAATFLHPTEALHGDLGKVGDYDAILLITYSGRTPELLQLLPHFNPSLPLLIITSHTHPSTCMIFDQRPDAILLPAPIHESELRSFGVSAPTTSTTIALALGDALAVTISREIHPDVSEVFLRNHPGGAIGQAEQNSKKVVELATCISEIPFITEDRTVTPQGMHVVMAGYKSSSGWVRYSNESVVPPRKIRRLLPEDMNLLATDIPGLIVANKDWIPVPADMPLREAATWIMSLKESHISGARMYDDYSIVAVALNGVTTGVVEVGTILSSS
jgi:D-arabinose 5-phosphate isomerase GutQ